MIQFKLTPQEFKSLLPLYKRAESSATKDCSEPVTREEFNLVVKINEKHGFNPPKNYLCSSCVLWNLSTVYRLLTNPENSKVLNWYKVHGKI